MGQQQSDAAEEKAVGGRSRYAVLHRQLYRNLTAPDPTGAPVDDNTFKNRFESYFGGPYPEFGHLLYSKLFGQRVPVDEEMFLTALTVLEKVCRTEGEGLTEGEGDMETEGFYFSVFSEGKDTIDRQQMTKVLHIAATFAMVVGSELHEQAALPKDHFLLTSITEAAWLHADKETGRLHKTQFVVWVSRQCTRLLEGLKQWTLSLLHGQPPQGETSGSTEQHTAAAAAPAALPSSSLHMPYQLPTPHLDRPGDDQQRLLKEREATSIIWVLSTILPLIYLGHKEDGRKKAKPKQDYPIGGTWSLLYSSSVHGFSMNRFQHHCSDYREPSVMVLCCRNDLGEKDYTFAIAMDTEWRDGTYFYGGEKFCFVQLQPSFIMMKTGPKLVSLNEKQRGFPTGLRVMTSYKYNQCLLLVEPSLEKAHFQGVELNVRKVEVWGCGGVEAIESQRRVKEWEKRLIMRQRKVRTADLKETWEDSPDRLILELGGVSTKRPREQQQE